MPRFQKMVSRKHAVLTDDVLVAAWNDGERMRLRTGIPERVTNLEVIDGDFYFDFDWVEKVTRVYADASTEALASFVAAGVSCGEKLKAFVRAINPSQVGEAAQKTFWESIELLKDLLVFLPLTHPLAKAVEIQVMDSLRSKGLVEPELSRVLLEISYPTKANGPVLEERALREIKRTAILDSSFDMEEALRNHAQMFAYLGYREPYSQGYNVDFFRQRLSEMNPEEPVNPRLTVTFVEEEEKMVELLREYVFFRNYRTEKLYEALFYLEHIWKTLARSHGLNETDLGWYRLAECSALFEQSERVSLSEIEVRKQGHGFLLRDNAISFIVGDVLKQKKATLNVVGSDVTELKGMVACSGTTTGKVKVLTSAKEQSKIEEGDVLVTFMTTPDYLPAMKRASAFVTDEGGITCHAAIVSRELGKPCIIGTRIATKVLRDGDEVEVDAMKGIVKILKKF